MKILQKLKFMFVRRDIPTEVRPDDMTSVGGECCGVSHSEASAPRTENDECCGGHGEQSENATCCGHDCECK